MNGILIDTSAWIDFFNSSSDVSNTIKQLILDDAKIY